LNISDKVAVIGIAKKHEEIFFPNDPVPLYLDKKFGIFKIIQQFARGSSRCISFHREKMSKNYITSDSMQLKELAKKTKTILLRDYKTNQYIKKCKL
jgi:excinuclease ABC subunit C